jgi:hypothetical protein
MDGTDEALQRALRYPYAIPQRSFVLDGGCAVELAGSEVGAAGREPQLAYGANAAPEALARKLGAGHEPLIAVRARLVGFDVVYSRHLSLYGAVPATLVSSPGTEVGAFVLYLTPGQRRAIELSEPNYELARLEGLECLLEGGEALRAADAHLSRHGCLELDGSPVALAEIPAAGRRLSALSQRQVLERVRATLAPHLGLEQFVLAASADPALGREWTARLRRR